MEEKTLDAEEKKLLEELDRAEWQSVKNAGEDLNSYKQAAQDTLKKDKRINIRVSERDLISIQKVAIEEGIPYQTLISSLLHKYANKKTDI